MSDQIEVPDVEMTFAVKIQASGEVRDGVTGELIENVPFESTVVMTESELLTWMKEMEDNG